MLGACSALSEDVVPPPSAAWPIMESTAPAAQPMSTNAFSSSAAGLASSSPSPTLRALPPEAREFSEAGALAFLDWWLDMYNYVEITGETDLIRQHSEPDCGFCAAAIDRIAGVFTLGGRIERQGESKFADVRVESLKESPRLAVIHLNAISPETVEYDQEGIVVDISPASREPFPGIAVLEHKGNAWLVVDIAAREES